MLRGDVVLSVVLSTFGIIFVAELPDKTALASLLLATRYRARDVILGAWLAFLVQTAVAVVAGSVLHLLPARPVRVAAGVGFLVFALLALRRNEEQAIDEESSEIREARAWHRAPWLICFAIVFAAEWGDLTQLATAALVANSNRPLLVAAGAVLALWAVTVIAAGAGSQLTRFLSPTLLTRASAVLFAVVGVIVIGTALG